MSSITAGAGGKITGPAPDAPGAPEGDPVPEFTPPGGLVQASATGSTGGTGSPSASVVSPETITYGGSGLVFVNTYGSGVTTAFRNEIVAAENYFQAHFNNSCTLNCTFNLQAINPNFSAENFFNPVSVSYSALRSALASHATSPDQLAAAASLATLADPSNGGTFSVPIGEARILGLAGPGSGTDDSVILNSDYWTAQSLQSSPGDAIGVIEHELSEGAMGRIGGATVDGWGPMDLFRFTASGQRDFTGGQDGQLTYFSPNGSNVYTGLQYHNPINAQGQDDGFDWADWDQVGADANATDPFGPGGPGAGDPGLLSTTDLRIMNVLGWNLQGSSVYVASTGNFNGDGYGDILVQNATTGAPTMWLLNGTLPTSGTALVNPGPTWHLAATGDFNDNGRSDLLWQNTDGLPAVWMMNGASIVNGGVLPNPGTSWHAVTTGDFNGNGNSDILWQNTDGLPAVWMMNGMSIVGAAVLPNPGTAWHVAATGDFNGNGDDDILWQNTDGLPAIWMMNGTTIVSGSVLPNPGTTWHAVGTWDLTGNGDADILWQNADGLPAIWVMNGTRLVSGIVLANPGSGWQLAGAGPLNNISGESELLFFNPGTGGVQVWDMNGTQVASMHVLANEPTGQSSALPTTLATSELDIAAPGSTVAANWGSAAPAGGISSNKLFMQS